MKKKLVLVLAVLLTLGILLTGCGSKGKSDQTGEDDTTETTQNSGNDNDADTPKGDPDHIIVTYLSIAGTPEDLNKIQDAVNEITIPAVNVEVEFKPLTIGDSFSNYSLWIGSDETIDLMMLAFQDIKGYVNSGQIEALDEFVTAERTPNLFNLMEEVPFGTYVGGELYGLSPIMPVYSQQYGLIMREEYLSETDYEKKDIYSMEDLTNIFKQIKENHPETYPFITRGGDVMPGSSLFNYLNRVDYLGGNNLAGALMNFDSTEVVNLFKTDEYKAFLQQVGEWYEAGYIPADAATMDTTGLEMMKSGKGASYAMSQQPLQLGVGYGFEITGLPTTDGGIGAVSNATNWVVPITSTNPEAAIRFMDYLYSDHALSNLIQWGIVDEHVEIVDEDLGVVDYADGLSDSNSPYYNSLGFWGDRRAEYTMVGTPTRVDNKEFEEKYINNKYKSYSFVFNSEPVTNQIMACQSVLDEYQKALETGSLGTDWESTYETMINQLDTAGINDIIAECQSQFDEFLAR